MSSNKNTPKVGDKNANKETKPAEVTVESLQEKLEAANNQILALEETRNKFDAQQTDIQDVKSIISGETDLSKSTFGLDTLAGSLANKLTDIGLGYKETIDDLNKDMGDVADIVNGVIDLDGVKYDENSLAAHVVGSSMVKSALAYKESMTGSKDVVLKSPQSSLGLDDPNKSRWMVAQFSQDKYGRIEVFSTGGDRSPGVMMRVMDADNNIVSASYSEKVACIDLKDGSGMATLQNKG